MKNIDFKKIAKFFTKNRILSTTACFVSITTLSYYNDVYPKKVICENSVSQSTESYISKSESQKYDLEECKKYIKQYKVCFFDYLIITLENNK